MVAVLRAEAGRNPYDRALTDLVGELSTRSEEFPTRWAAPNFLFHRTGFKQLHHPVVGDLDLTYEALELPADPGLTLLVYTAKPGTPTQGALDLLAGWAARRSSRNNAPSRKTPTTRRNRTRGHRRRPPLCWRVGPETRVRGQITRYPNPASATGRGLRREGYQQGLPQAGGRT